MQFPVPFYSSRKYGHLQHPSLCPRTPNHRYRLGSCTRCHPSFWTRCGMSECFELVRHSRPVFDHSPLQCDLLNKMQLDMTTNYIVAISEQLTNDHITDGYLQHFGFVHRRLSQPTITLDYSEYLAGGFND